MSPIITPGGGGSGGGSQPTIQKATTADSPIAAAAGTLYLLDASAGPVIFNLPAPVINTTVWIKKTDGVAHPVTVNPPAGALIDPLGSSGSVPVLDDFMSASYVADGTNWWTITQPGVVMFNHVTQLLSSTHPFAGVLISDAESANNSGSGFAWNFVTGGLSYAQMTVGPDGTLSSTWDATGGYSQAKGIAAFGVTPPASQPATPTTLAQVIAILQGAGLCS